MSYKHIGLEERYQISALLQIGTSISKIAARLNRNPSTISREVKRNSRNGAYDPDQAHGMATDRAIKSRILNAPSVSLEARQAAIDLLLLDWSPDQISHWLRQDQGLPISAETIYQMVIQDRKNGGTLYTHLRRRHRKYARRLGNPNQRGQIKNRRPLEERPEAVNARSESGHWEGDTVIGTQARSQVIVTLVERKSRFLVARLAACKSAEAVTSAILDGLRPIEGMVETITFDNGKEFAAHEQIDRELGSTTYFARPYHSWERGTNENTNGLLRQYFPKGVPMDDLTPQVLAEAVSKINNRPRRTLGYRTPAEVFAEDLKKLQEIGKIPRIALRS